MRYFYVVGLTNAGFLATFVESSGELVLKEAIKVLTESKTTNNAVITWFHEVTKDCVDANRNAQFPPTNPDENDEMDELP